MIIIKPFLSLSHVSVIFILACCTVVGLKKTSMISALRHEDTTADSLSCGVVQNPPELHVEEHTNNLQLNAHLNQV